MAHLMRYVFLDTNNWIYLSNGFNIYSNKHDELHFKVFELMKKRVLEGSLCFLTNDLIIQEWNRNRKNAQNQIKELRDKLHSHLNSLKAIDRLLENGNDGKEIEAIKSKLLETVQKKIAKHEQHILEVEDFLLHKTTTIEIPDHIKVRAANLATEKKAPFIGDKKNSMADALILLSSVEHIEKKCGYKFSRFESDDAVFYPENYFVSSNSGDFSAPDNREQIHPDLSEFLNKTETRFFYSFSKLIEFLEAEFLSEEEADMMDTHNADCPICNFPYARTVEFSSPYTVFDPYKQRKARNFRGQINLQFEEEDTPVSEPDPIESEIIEGHCTHCDADFFICPECGEMNHLDHENSTFDCEFQCGYQFILHVDRDRKGIVEGWELQIVASKECQRCGETVEAVSESGLCDDCEEHYGTSN